MYVFAVKHEKLSGCLEIESSMMKLGSADRGLSSGIPPINHQPDRTSIHQMIGRCLFIRSGCQPPPAIISPTYSARRTTLSMLRRSSCTKIIFAGPRITRCASPCYKFLDVARRQPLAKHFTSNTIRRGHVHNNVPAFGDTIYALSTAHGRAGIAVIRISGPSCLQVSFSM